MMKIRHSGALALALLLPCASASRTSAEGRSAGHDDKGKDPKHDAPRPVTVVNTAANPVPVAPQGTTAIAGAVSIEGTPTVNVANLPDIAKVEVTNFPAAGSGSALAPSAGSQLVDLVTNSPCPSVGGQALDNQVQADGARSSFSIPVGQILVVTDVSATVSLGSAAAGHAVGIRLARASASTFNPFDFRTLTLDSQGTGTVAVTLGHGSRFLAGTSLCLVAQDLVTAAMATTFGFAHGFLASDN